MPSRTERRLINKKAEAIAKVEAKRDVMRYANVAALAHTWQADPNSQALLSSAINLGQAGLGIPAEWRDADNVNMPVGSLTDLLAIAGAMALQTQTAYSWSWAKKALIEAATTEAELAAIDLGT